VEVYIEIEGVPPNRDVMIAYAFKDKAVEEEYRSEGLLGNTTVIDGVYLDRSLVWP
jgi:hypothetical protein